MAKRGRASSASSKVSASPSEWEEDTHPGRSYRKKQKTNETKTKGAASSTKPDVGAADETLGTKTKNPYALLKNKKVAAEERAEAAEAENKRLVKDNERLATQNQYFKDKMLAGDHQGRHYVQDDHTVCNNVKLLFETIAAWAGEWSHEGHLVQHLGLKASLRVSALLLGEQKSSLPKVMRTALEEIFPWTSTSCRLATETILAHKVFRLFVVRPFHFLSKKTQGVLKGEEDSIAAIRAQMRDGQNEKQLWNALTLRSLYASYQYAGPIFEPLLDDSFKDIRCRQFDNQVTLWLLGKVSPLMPLLRACSHEELKTRSGLLLKILRGAAKLSLQLWVQDATVELFHELQYEESPCFGFDSLMTEGNPLMRVFTEDGNLSGQKVDLVVRPGIKLNRLDVKDGHRSTLVAAKASVMVFLGKKWKENAREYDEAQGKAMEAAIANQYQNSASRALEARRDQEARRSDFESSSAALTAALSRRFGQEVNDTVPANEVQGLDVDKASPGPTVFRRAASAPPEYDRTPEGPDTAPDCPRADQGDVLSDTDAKTDTQNATKAEPIAEGNRSTTPIPLIHDNEDPSHKSVRTSTEETTQRGPDPINDAADPATESKKPGKNRGLDQARSGAGVGGGEGSKKEKKKAEEGQAVIEATWAEQSSLTADLKVGMDKGQKNDKDVSAERNGSKSSTALTPKIKYESGSSMDDAVELD